MSSDDNQDFHGPFFGNPDDLFARNSKALCVSDLDVACVHVSR